MNEPKPRVTSQGGCYKVGEIATDCYIWVIDRTKCEKCKEDCCGRFYEPGGYVESNLLRVRAGRRSGTRS